MKHYLIKELPTAADFLSGGKTRVVLDIIRVPAIPVEVSLETVENPKYDSENVLWYEKAPNEFYRINVFFVDNLGIFDPELNMDKAVLALCEKREVFVDDFQVGVDEFEFRCREFGIYPKRMGHVFKLMDPVSNNEARLIAFYHKQIVKYDELYAKSKATNPAFAALSELDLLQ